MIFKEDKKKNFSVTFALYHSSHCFHTMEATPATGVITPKKSYKRKVGLMFFSNFQLQAGAIMAIDDAFIFFFISVGRVLLPAFRTNFRFNKLKFNIFESKRRCYHPVYLFH